MFALFNRRRMSTRPVTRIRLGTEGAQLEDREQLSVTLGTAANFAALGLVNAQIYNGMNVTIAGSEGVSQGGMLSGMLFSTVNGNVDEYAAGQYSGLGRLNGRVVTDPAMMNQADRDALDAAAAAQTLAPTQTFGTISNPSTVTGTSGLNVIQVNGDIVASVMLTGPADAEFIVNVSGSLILGGRSSLAVGGQVTSARVLYNFTGSSLTISTQAGNVLNGTLLAPTYSVTLNGTVNGAVITGGTSLFMPSGAKVNWIAFTGLPPAVVTASLSGTVRDINGNPLAGLTLTLTGTDTGNNLVTATSITDATGNYSFPGLAAGTYTITLTYDHGAYSSAGGEVGSLGGQGSDGTVSDIPVNGVDGTGYNFILTTYG
jgi:choice-of-anchor A domain-containing protein